MKRLGLWEDTLVIATSDHGEILDKHPGQFDHHGLYDDNIRVPLIIRFPGDEHAGRRVDALVSNVDLAPTVCECLGLPAPSQFEGESLMPLIRGKRTEQYPELYLGEATYQCKRGVRTRDWKLIRALSTSVRHNWHGDGRRELYHLPSDPWEQTNLIHMWPSVARELEARLDRWLDAQRAKWGHEDPIKVQGISIARRMLKAQRQRDRERDWEIR
jgi:arylsulfatase A-like enzyme